MRQWSLTTVVVAALVVWGVRQRGGSIATVEAPSLVIGRQQQLTAADEIEFDPSFSPGSDLIAYPVGHGARFRLVVREVGTNREIPVPVDQDGLQFQPRWSPDGNTLLYLARDGVFVWPLSGGQRRRVASPSDAPGTYTMFLREGPAITAAAWSPDGREIAVAYGGNLVALEKDGKSRRPLAASPDELHWCDWSPKGTWIACTAGNLHLPYSEHHFGNIAPSSIVLVPTGGGQLIEIAPKTSMNQSPIWSADGRRLYFVSNRHGTSDIYGIDISEDGTPVGNTIRLTTGLGAFSIVMSGDRERLAYAQLAARSNVWSLPIPTNGRLVDIAGARQLTSANQVIEAMHVTPDRKWLVYDSNLHGNSDIFRMPLDGGEPTRLTTDPADDFAPAVSADGRWVAFHSWRTKSRDIFVQPFDGGPAQQVTASSGQESFPVWLPDGSLAFVDQAKNADGLFRGTFLTQPNPRGGWETPRLLLPRAGGLKVARDGRFIYALDTNIHMSRRDDSASRVIYRPNLPELPHPAQFGVGDDGETVYFKAHDAAGRASFWVLPLTGAPARMLVRFDDLSRPSRRWDFAVADGQFFFAIDERRSNIWLADVVER